MRKTSGRYTCLIAAVVMAFAPGVRAQSATESQMKAAFLYSFAKFVEWPADSYAERNTPITIGIMGKDPFGRDLEDIVRGRSAAGRPVVVRRYSVKEVPQSQILFVSASERKRIAELLDPLKHAPVLTVSDISDFAERGGMIEFIAEDGHIRLEINMNGAQAAGLKISSKLLGAATLVHEQRREPR